MCIRRHVDACETAWKCMCLRRLSACLECRIPTCLTGTFHLQHATDAMIQASGSNLLHLQCGRTCCGWAVWAPCSPGPWKTSLGQLFDVAICGRQYGALCGLDRDIQGRTEVASAFQGDTLLCPCVSRTLHRAGLAFGRGAEASASLPPRLSFILRPVDSLSCPLDFQARRLTNGEPSTIFTSKYSPPRVGEL